MQACRHAIREVRRQSGVRNLNCTTLAGSALPVGVPVELNLMCDQPHDYAVMPSPDGRRARVIASGSGMGEMRERCHGARRLFTTDAVWLGGGLRGVSSSPSLTDR